MLVSVGVSRTCSRVRTAMVTAAISRVNLDIVFLELLDYGLAIEALSTWEGSDFHSYTSSLRSGPDYEGRDAWSHFARYHQTQMFLHTNGP